MALPLKINALRLKEYGEVVEISVAEGDEVAEDQVVALIRG